MKRQLNRYKFDKISSTMGKEFGTIRPGEEDFYDMLFRPMEGNLLKLHREDPKRNGRRVIEAIHICLLTIDGYLTGTEYDFGSFLDDGNRDFVRGLLMSFDPFTNDEIKAVVEEWRNLESPDELRSYFKEPVMCLLRIEKSIENWSREYGANGYFDFLESVMGQDVPRDLKMNFSVLR